MSDRSSLAELARFVGKARPSTEDQTARRRAISAIAKGIKPKSQRPSVADLLGVVLVLSARTRRAMLPRVNVELDVFAPHGNRAVRMMLPRR